MKPLESNSLTSQQSEALMTAAREASARAYAPYSRFHVGAAVLADDGRVFTAANVENASYGLTSCAERNAIFAAVSAGARRIVGVAIHTPTAQPVSPCGACRQVIQEFGPDATVVSCCDGDGCSSWSVEELLPGAFGAKDL
ncbi:MAG: cytidine deaminase [Burkholderiaceae bacterium]